MATARLPIRLITLSLILLLLSLGSPAQAPTSSEIPISLVLVASASDVKRSTDGFLHDGCDNLSYVVEASYPATEVLESISKELRAENWILTRKANRKWAPGSAYSFKAPGKWEHFVSVTGGTTYVREDQWEKAGAVTTYHFSYFGPDSTKLHVKGRYCSLRAIEKYRCQPGALAPHNEKMYSLSVSITNIAPQQKDFKVFTHIENNGTEQVLLGVNGTLPDSSPELWVLGVEQMEQGEWSSVDVVCAEHPAMDWITLKPGESVNSWVMAVDFPEPNQWFAKCRRRIGHLHGQIRATIRYYTNACEIEGAVENKQPFVARSHSVELPVADH